MTELWLVRHAESLGNLDGSEADTALSAQGRAQALALRDVLDPTSFDRIVTSPLVRASETVSLALPDDIEPEVDARLRELVVPGERYLDLAALSEGALTALLSDAPEPVETGLEFRARLRDWLDEVEGRVLAFTHAGVIRELARLCGRPPDAAPAHASITRLSWRRPPDRHGVD